MRLLPLLSGLPTLAGDPAELLGCVATLGRGVSADGRAIPGVDKDGKRSPSASSNMQGLPSARLPLEVKLRAKASTWEAAGEDDSGCDNPSLVAADAAMLEKSRSHLFCTSTAGPETL